MSKSKPMTKLQKTVNLLSRQPADATRQDLLPKIMKLNGFQERGASTYLQLARKAIADGVKATPTRVRKAKAA